MSVSSTNNVVILNADGSTHSFTFNFKIFAASDLKVIVRSSAGIETDQTLNSQYIIPDSSVDNASGGNILFKFNTGTSSDAHFSSTDFRPANGSKVILRQNIPLTQTLDLVNNDPFDAETLESSLDRIVLQVQSVKEAVDRSIKFSRSNLLDSSGSQISSTYVDIEEDTTARANKLLSFDSTGTPIATQEVGTAKGDWAASTVYQERDIVRDTSTNNLFIVNTAHTSSGSEPLTSNANSSKYTIILNNGAYTNITASGVITGSTIEPTGDTSSGDNAAIGHTSDEGLILTGQGAVSDITFKNDVDVTVFTIPTGTDDILFPDNAKILIGSGSDLRIYHESDNSYIDERGSGRLYILSDTQVEIGNAGNATNARFNSGGSSILHYNNSNKFETSDTGATLTGALTVSSHVVTSEIQLTSGAQPDVRFESTSGGDRFDLGIDATSVFRLRNINDSRDDLKFDGSGVATFGGAVNITGALTVTGGIADSNLNTITTADKVSGAAIQIDGATDGTSITIVDADKLLIDDNGTTKYINASQLNSYISAAASAVAADNITAGDAAVTLTTTSGNITIDAQANNSNIIFKGTDGSVDTTFLTISGADAGQATFNGKIVADAGIDVDDFNIDGTAITLSAGNFSLNADSNILLNTHYDGSTSGGIIALKENNTNFGQLRNNSGELQIKSGASDTTALTFAGADATFAGSATIGSDVTSASGNFVTSGSNIALKHSSGENFFTASKDQGSFIYHDAYGILGTVATNAVAIGTTNGNTFTLDTQSTFLEIGNSGIGGGTDAGTVVLSATSNANDERIGDIRFANVANADDDGTDADGKMVARIQSKSVTSDSNAGDDSGGTIVFSTKPEAGSIATALTLGSDQSATFGGNVGIGNSSPSYLLSLSSASTTQAEIKTTATNGTAQIRFTNDARTYTLGIDNNDTFFLYDATGTSSRFVVNSSGNVGIGTISPSTGLSVVTGSANGIELGQDSDASTDSARLFFSTSGGSNAIHSSSGAMRFFTGSTAGSSSGTERMRIDSNGRVGIAKTPDSSLGSFLQIEGNDGIAVGRSGQSNHFIIRPNASTDGLRFTQAGTGDRVTIDSSGNVGIGTTSPLSATNFTALTVQNNTYGGIVQVKDDTVDLRLQIQADTSGRVGTHSNHPLRFDVNSTERMRIDTSGNVGIGTTSVLAKLHSNVGASSTTGVLVENANDASSTGDLIKAFSARGDTSAYNLLKAENSTGVKFLVSGSGNVGIGTSSPQRTLHVHDDSTYIQITNDTTGTASGDGFRMGYFTGQTIFTMNQQENDDFVFSTNNTERMRIDSSGNVGIGTTSNLLSGTNRTTLSINNSDSAAIAFGKGGTNEAFIYSDDSSLEISSKSNNMRFSTSDAERMRIDSSGHLLVGTTDNNVADNSGTSNSGFNVRSSGRVLIAEPQNAGLWVNRLGDDGDIAVFRKDGTTVGSIFSSGGQYLGIGNDDVGLLFLDVADDIRPWNTSTNAARDNAIDLGNSDARFDDIFATNGTIQTSDENEKQDIASMTTAELAVGKRLSTLFKTFRWKDKVTEKADKARTHSGIVAQEVKAAFEAEGLDATKYALFCSDTWTNDDGKEQTRMGVRYPELLSFIASYNESRFTAIEARLTALEGV